MFFEVYEFRFKYNGFYTFMVTSGFATTHVVVSVRQPINY